VISLIDRYISKNFIYFFIAGLTVFVTLFLTIDYVTTASKYSVGLFVFAKYYTYYGLEILYQLFPVACLLATLFTLGTLHKNNEIIAMFSLGLGLLRIAVPILTIVSIMSVSLFFLSNQFMTKIIDKRNYIWLAVMKKTPWKYATSKQEHIWYRSGQNIFNIDLLNAKEAKAFGVKVYTFSYEWHLQQILEAKEALVENGQWILKDGRVTVFFDENSAPISEKFAERTLVIGEDVIDIKTSSSASAVMGVGELRKYIARNKEAGLDTTPFEVDYFAKFSFIFSALVMVLLGVSFSGTSSPRSGGVLYNLQKCLVLTLVYWAFYTSALTLGRHGFIPPIVAAWGPNILMIGFASLLIWRQKK
jgi:lipopolysaccharide export system permease protein